MTAQTVEKIGQATEKLRHAQDAADAYLARLNGVLAEAHKVFSENMLNTVKKANVAFHQELMNSTQLVSQIAVEFEEVFSAANGKGR